MPTGLASVTEERHGGKFRKEAAPAPDQPITWHVVRRENLTSWVMPSGEDEDGVAGHYWAL